VLAAALEKPFLGICIGLQMLFERSEEGDTPGLGLLEGSVRRFPAERMTGADGGRLKVPHMGWNEVEQLQTHDLWRGIPQRSRFYFVHSYYVEPAPRALAAGATDYGLRFTCAVARDNVFAVQFHPEKSQAAGLALLANFVAWRPAPARDPRNAAAAREFIQLKS
jgi:imidazole glycerol-phosphate synthase subunit HisH